MPPGVGAGAVWLITAPMKGQSTMTNVTHKIDPNQRKDLMDVYLEIHASAITTTIPEIATRLDLKRSYVAELVGILKSHADRNGNPFVIVNSEPGENGNDEPHDWLQTWHTVDDHDGDMAMHWFEEHFPVQQATQPKAPTPRTPLNATNPADLPLCLCGCKHPVTNRNRNYKPGHDARHAGQVAREMAATTDTGRRDALKAALPTDALKWKAATMADRLLQKEAAKDRNKKHATEGQIEAAIEAGESAKRTHISGPAVRPVTFEVGEVKIGRWFYKAERNSASGSVTFTRKDKTEVATDKVAASFTPEA